MTTMVVTLTQALRIARFQTLQMIGLTGIALSIASIMAITIAIATPLVAEARVKTPRATLQGIGLIGIAHPTTMITPILLATKNSILKKLATNSSLMFQTTLGMATVMAIMAPLTLTLTAVAATIILVAGTQVELTVATSMTTITTKELNTVEAVAMAKARAAMPTIGTHPTTTSHTTKEVTADLAVEATTTTTIMITLLRVMTMVI